MLEPSREHHAQPLFAVLGDGRHALDIEGNSPMGHDRNLRLRASSQVGSGSAHGERVDSLRVPVRWERFRRDPFF